MAKLVPPYHLKLQSNKEWKKAISEVYKKQMGMTSEDAKINYLRFVFPWSTFGSSFFDVKQTTEKRFPENITIAINKNGIFILDRQTREPLTLYPFHGGDQLDHYKVNVLTGRKLCAARMRDPSRLQDGRPHHVLHITSRASQ
ncbi:myosin-VIIa-like [Homalodisca vitripennis]|uniref:myosin-VIIa-like n=1 Tax=Homalodisca vitripennis TaxID=197043 RepID=UPI001EE9B69F|nr:myosin-VIIa-like [Homalodisca vitripennis]